MQRFGCFCFVGSNELLFLTKDSSPWALLPSFSLIRFCSSLFRLSVSFLEYPLFDLCHLSLEKVQYFLISFIPSFFILLCTQLIQAILSFCFSSSLWSVVFVRRLCRSPCLLLSFIKFFVIIPPLSVLFSKSNSCIILKIFNPLTFFKTNKALGLVQRFGPFCWFKRTFVSY